MSHHAARLEDLFFTRRDFLNRCGMGMGGLALGIDYAITLTCYDPAPDGAACGRCEACLIRLKGFREAGMEDPAPYQTVSGEAI